MIVYDITAVGREVDRLMREQPDDPCTETAIELWCRLTGLARDDAIDHLIRDIATSEYPDWPVEIQAYVPPWVPA